MTKDPQPPERFLLKGQHITPSIDARITKIQGERKYCLSEIKGIIKKNSPDLTGDALLESAINAMTAVLNSDIATGPSLSIIAHLERAAALQKEHTYLMCVRRNMNPEQTYSLTVEDAKRYGLY